MASFFIRGLSAPMRFLALPSCVMLAATALALAQENETEPQTSNAVQQERVFSGPQPGEVIHPFRVLGIQGDQEKELEIANTKEEESTLICFVHRLSNDDRVLYGLGLVDFYVAKHATLTNHIVLLTDDREMMMKRIERWSPLFGKSMLCVSMDGAEGPGSYGLNRNVAMTVVVAKGNEVVDNFVFQAPNNRDLQTIMASVARSLGQPEPKLAEVLSELRTERKRKADKRIKASVVFKLAPNEQLGRIMYSMVHGRGNRAKNAERRTKQLLEWAGDREERRSALKQYCQAVLDGKYSTNQYSTSALRKLAAN